MRLIRYALAGLMAALICSPAFAQPQAYLSAPTGTPTYVSPNTPIPTLSESFATSGSPGTISGTTTSSNIALPANGSLIEITNSGSVTAYVALGIGSGTVATTQSFAIPAGQVAFLNNYIQSVGTPATFIAGITATSTASLSVQMGNLQPGAGGGGGGSTNATIVGPLGTQTAAASVAVTLGSSTVVSGAYVDCAIVTIGCEADAAWVSGSGTAISILKGIYGNTGAAIPAGTNLIGKTGIDQTTPGTTNAVSLAQVGANTVLTGNGVSGTGSQRVNIASDNTAFSVNPQATTTTGVSTKSIQVAANTTSVAVDASAGTLLSVRVFNNSATIAYAKFYNASQGSTTCGSGTPVNRIMIPGQTGGAGAVFALGGGFGVAYGTAITVCITTGFADNDSTSPGATTYIVEADYR